MSRMLQFLIEAVVPDVVTRLLDHTEIDHFIGRFASAATEINFARDVSTICQTKNQYALMAFVQRSRAALVSWPNIANQDLIAPPIQFIASLFKALAQVPGFYDVHISDSSRAGMLASWERRLSETVLTAHRYLIDSDSVNLVSMIYDPLPDRIENPRLQVMADRLFEQNVTEKEMTDLWAFVLGRLKQIAF